MKLVVKLIPYYWIIQGGVIATAIKGFGGLSLIGGILLIIYTILYLNVNRKRKQVFAVLYLLYSILFIIMMSIVFLFFGFCSIHILISIVAILNIAFSFIQLKYLNFIC